MGSLESSGGGGRLAIMPGRVSRKDKHNPFAGIEKQSYAEVTKTCSERGILFEDPEFPADYCSLYFEGSGDFPVEWKRPSKICEDPKFFVGGASRCDVKQGYLGDCWLLAAIASLTINPKLLSRVVPGDQYFRTDYTGCFRFNLWNQGKWVEILVDDRLPTENGRLIYMHSVDEDEFWSALLEKAYAKLNGSYESLCSGRTPEAMEGFTGGITEQIDLKDPPKKLFGIMQKALQRCSMMGCSINSVPDQVEAKLSNSLICGHAYSVTGLTTLDASNGPKTPSINGKIPMVRIRNPWGKREWNGPWSDKSPEWSIIPDNEKKNLGLIYDDDGEFWMSFEDFCSQFNCLEICNLAPDSLDEEELNTKSKKRWEMTMISGSWLPGLNAGGCINYRNTFWTNPQYRLDENDSGGIKGLNFFKHCASCDKTPGFINSREIFGRHKLPPGNYLIIPSTFKPNTAGDFLIRLFTEKQNKTVVVDEETGLKETEPEAEADAAIPEKLRKSFKTNAGEDMEMDACELRDFLNTVFKEEFGIETCRSMVALHDGDMSGKLGFDEFQILYKDVCHFKRTFEKFEINKSGNLYSYDLRSALNDSGFKLSNKTFQAVVARYSNKTELVTFEDFVACATRLKSMLVSLKSQDNSGISLDDFIPCCMYS